MASYGTPVGRGAYDPRGPPIYNQSGPTVVNVVGTHFGTKPVSLTCQFCKTPITTNVVEECSCCSVCLCILTGFVFWVCVQCCRNKEINCCDATHTCPNCGQVLGYYKSC